MLAVLGTNRCNFGALGSVAQAADMPKPFDKPGDVKIALVRYLSTGDFFQAYLSGVEKQAAALGVDLRVLDSRQDAALQADMVDQAIALGVDGIIVQHGLTESMQAAVQRAVDAGIKVVAFDGDVKNKAVPQVGTSGRGPARVRWGGGERRSGGVFRRKKFGHAAEAVVIEWKEEEGEERGGRKFKRLFLERYGYRFYQRSQSMKVHTLRRGEERAQVFRYLKELLLSNSGREVLWEQWGHIAKWAKVTIIT